DDGTSRAPYASGQRAASPVPFYFAWGCFSNFVFGPAVCRLGGSSSRLRWRRSRGLCNRITALVNPRVAPAEARHHFVADGAEMVGEFVDCDAFADQRHHM